MYYSRNHFQNWYGITTRIGVGRDAYVPLLRQIADGSRGVHGSRVDHDGNGMGMGVKAVGMGIAYISCL